MRELRTPALPVTELVCHLDRKVARSLQTRFKEQRTKIVRMLVTIGQINTINGDWESNTASIIRAIEQGKRDRSDLVVLPEVSVQGYTSLDWFLDRDLERCSLKPLEKI